MTRNYIKKDAAAEKQKQEKAKSMVPEQVSDAAVRAQIDGRPNIGPMWNALATGGDFIDYLNGTMGEWADSVFDDTLGQLVYDASGGSVDPRKWMNGSSVANGIDLAEDIGLTFIPVVGPGLVAGKGVLQNARTMGEGFSGYDSETGQPLTPEQQKQKIFTSGANMALMAMPYGIGKAGKIANKLTGGMSRALRESDRIGGRVAESLKKETGNAADELAKVNKGYQDALDEVTNGRKALAESEGRVLDKNGLLVEPDAANAKVYNLLDESEAAERYLQKKGLGDRFEYNPESKSFVSKRTSGNGAAKSALDTQVAKLNSDWSTLTGDTARRAESEFFNPNYVADKSLYDDIMEAGTAGESGFTRFTPDEAFFKKYDAGSSDLLKKSPGYKEFRKDVKRGLDKNYKTRSSARGKTKLTTNASIREASRLIEEFEAGRLGETEFINGIEKLWNNDKNLFPNSWNDFKKYLTERANPTTKANQDIRNMSKGLMGEGSDYRALMQARKELRAEGIKKPSEAQVQARAARNSAMAEREAEFSKAEDKANGILTGDEMQGPLDKVLGAEAAEAENDALRKGLTQFIENITSNGTSGFTDAYRRVNAAFPGKGRPLQGDKRLSGLRYITSRGMADQLEALGLETDAKMLQSIAGKLKKVGKGEGLLVAEGKGGKKYKQLLKTFEPEEVEYLTDIVRSAGRGDPRGKALLEQLRAMGNNVEELGDEALGAFQTTLDEVLEKAGKEAAENAPTRSKIVNALTNGAKGVPGQAALNALYGGINYVAENPDESIFDMIRNNPGMFVASSLAGALGGKKLASMMPNLSRYGQRKILSAPYSQSNLPFMLWNAGEYGRMQQAMQNVHDIYGNVIPVNNIPTEGNESDTQATYTDETGTVHNINNMADVMTALLNSRPVFNRGYLRPLASTTE